MYAYPGMRRSKRRPREMVPVLAQKKRRAYPPRRGRTRPALNPAWGRGWTFPASRVPRFPKGVIGFPDRIQMCFTWASTYDDNHTATWISTHAFRMNSLNDPDTGGVNTKPQDYNQIAGPIYQFYRVYAVNAELTAAPQITPATGCFLAIMPSNTTTDTTSFDGLVAADNAQVLIWHLEDTTSVRYMSQKTLKAFYKMKDLAWEAEEMTAYNADPSSVIYLLVKTGDQANGAANRIRFTLKLTFYAELFRRAVTDLDT